MQEWKGRGLMSDRVGRVKNGMCNNAGNVAIIFAFSLMAVFGAAGLALDFGRSHAVRTSVQSSLDAAVLAAAKTGESDDAAINAAVQGFISAPLRSKVKSQPSSTRS